MSYVLTFARAALAAAVLTGSLVFPGISFTHSIAHADADTPGAVYTSTNAPGGNAVEVFNRAADGSLAPAGMYPTGGTGTGAGLGSQSALTLSENARWLFVVNAGSNSISSFAVEPDGLQLAGTTASGGQQPISLTVNHGILYVLNA